LTPNLTPNHAGSLISDVLMSGSRQAGMKPPLWATLIPTSETWSVQDLLKELAAEHQAMQQRES